jgi:hypothetical protein
MINKLADIIFEEGFSEADEIDAFQRGYRSHVWVVLDNGSRFQVTFYDITRLTQELNANAKDGQPFFTEPGLIVLKEISRKNMELAVKALVEDGFFEENTDVI